MFNVNYPHLHIFIIYGILKINYKPSFTLFRNILHECNITIFTFSLTNIFKKDYFLQPVASIASKRKNRRLILI